MYEQRATIRVHAPSSAVYAALLDHAAVERWRVPDDMTATVLEWEPVEGGRFRVSLTYRDPERAGKSQGATDTYTGTFSRLVPDVEVVERIEFDTDEDALRGAMTMTWTLGDVDGATEVELLHEGIPDSVPAADNEIGTRMAMTKLAAYVEGAG